VLGFLFALSVIVIIGGIPSFCSAGFTMSSGVVNAVLAVLGGYTMSTTYHLVTSAKSAC